MHGSYQHDQIDNRAVENGLVETIAVLISKMPRLRPSLPPGSPGQAFNFKPEFTKAWERWRSQVAKLDASTYWGECNHPETLRGLKKLVKILLGSIDDLLAATSHWIELLVAHLLHVQPFSKVSLPFFHLEHMSSCFSLHESQLTVNAYDYCMSSLSSFFLLKETQGAPYPYYILIYSHCCNLMNSAADCYVFIMKVMV
jgi:hypothetical protein